MKINKNKPMLMDVDFREITKLERKDRNGSKIFSYFNVKRLKK